MTRRDEEVIIRVVGVDATSLVDGKIGAGSPAALALLGARVGDKARVRAPREPEAVEVVGIRHPEPRSNGWSACVLPGQDANAAVRYPTGGGLRSAKPA